MYLDPVLQVMERVLGKPGQTVIIGIASGAGIGTLHAPGPGTFLGAISGGLLGIAIEGVVWCCRRQD